MLNSKKMLLAAVMAAVAAAPALVGAATNSYIINDPQEITAFGHGYDIAKIEFTLDINDQLTIQLFPYGVPGDADGDGTSSDGYPNDAIADYPGVGAGEVISIGMVCAFDGINCDPNFGIIYTNNQLSVVVNGSPQDPAALGITFELLEDQYLVTIPSVTALKEAVLGTVPPSVTFGAFSFTFSVLDQNLDDYVPDQPGTCELVDLVPPVVVSPGTATIGYWKNHPTEWPANCDLSLPGSDLDPDVFAMNVLEAPVRGDKTVSMAKQLIAAKLNVCAGNDDSCISDSIDAASDWLSDPNHYVFSKYKSWDGQDIHHELMDDYNNGKLCVPHRD